MGTSSHLPRVKVTLPGGPGTRLLAAAEEKRTRVHVRRSLIEFCHFTYPRYQAGWHHRSLAAALEEIAWGKIKRLMVFMPPQHGKSELCSVRFPAWYLGHKPQHSLIGGSYGDRLAQTLSRAVQTCLANPNYQRLWPWQLQTENVVCWQLKGKEDARPSYVAAGVGGAISGQGANGLILDDPIKNYQQAYSKTYRDAVWEWYRSTALTRLRPEGWVVLIMTRWHEDDLAGRLLRAEPSTWRVLSLPAQHLDGTVLDLNAYDALWPEQYGLPELERIRREVGPHVWSSLYQQRPQQAQGSIFKRPWFRYFQRADVPEFELVLQAWDTAYEPGQENDPSVCETWGFANRNAYLLDVWRDQVSWPELERAARQQALRFAPHVVLVENKGSGISLRQQLTADENFRWPVLPMPANLSKVVRATQVTGVVEGGQVYLLADAPWLADFLDEVCGFDKWPHDDQVDALVHALTYYYVGTEQRHATLVTHEEPVELSSELAEFDGYAPGVEQYLEAGDL